MIFCFVLLLLDTELPTISVGNSVCNRLMDLKTRLFIGVSYKTTTRLNRACKIFVSCIQAENKNLWYNQRFYCFV